MLDVRNLLRGYSKQFTNDTVRHVLLNWSETEQCIRHPHGPLGWMLRDQGQVHLYSGKTHQVMGVDGEFVQIATDYAVLSENINMTPRGIETFRILGKNFVKQIFLGQPVVAVKPTTNVALYSVIGPDTKVIVDGRVGDIIGAVPIEEIFDITAIFESNLNMNNLIPADAEIFNYVEGAMGI